MTRGELRAREPIDPWLTGTFDLHVHAAPDVVERRCDDLELAAAASEAQMAGLLLKAHFFSSVERARLMTGIEAAGGLVLNDAVGGLNPAAVEAALALGARCVWMPTLSAEHHRRVLGGGPGGITVLDDGSTRLVPEAIEIVDLLARADVMLATGHLSPIETEVLVAVARRRGVQRILVTHAESVVGLLSADAQRALVRAGAVIEHCYIALFREGGSFPLDAIVESIRATGAGSCVISTDLGQPQNPHPVSGMAAFMRALAAAGISDSDLDKMARVTPIALCTA